MPNWCNTTFVFSGEPKEIAELHAFVKRSTERTKEHLESSGFNADWLGNVLIEAGLKDLIDKPIADGGVSCRGAIMDISDLPDGDDVTTFNLTTETAWVPMGKMWAAVIEKLQLNSVQFCYEAEECGCEIYQIYDPHELGYFDNDQVYIDYLEYTEEAGALLGYYTLEDFISTALDFLGLTEQEAGEDAQSRAKKLAKLLVDKTKDEEGQPTLVVHFFTYIQDLYD